MTSVERIVEFTKIEQEPSLETSADTKLPKEWPEDGCVEFKNVSLKYSLQDAYILKSISFTCIFFTFIGYGVCVF